MNKRILLSSILFGSILTFSLNSCKKEELTAPEPEPQTVISQNARPIDNTTAQQLQSVSSDGATFTFSSQATAITNLRANDIMILNAQQGYLRKVASVQQQPNSIVVQTSDASLTDAIEKGEVSISRSLNKTNLSSVTLPEGITLKSIAADPTAIIFQIDNALIYDPFGDPNRQIRANGSLQITPTFEFSIKLQNAQLRRLVFSQNITETANLTITAGVQYQINRSIEIGRLTFNPIVVTVGPVPLVITPQLGVYVGIDGSASASFSSGVTQQATFTAAIQYDNSAWTSSQNLTNSFSFNAPTLTSSMQGKGYAGVFLELLVYGVLAPRATADAYLRIAANPSSTPWWNLYGGLSVGAGVTVQILGRNIANYSLPNLISHERLLASAPTTSLPTTTTLAASSITSNSVTLNGSVNPNGSATSAWFEYGTSPILSTYTSTTAQSIGSGTIAQNVNQPIGSLSASTTYYYRVAGSNSVGTNRGSILSFTTTAAGNSPTVTTLAASSITSSGATLNGTVNPNGLSTNAWFEYGTSPTLSTYTSTTPQNIGSGSGTLNSNQSVSNLSSNTIYYFRTAGSNSAGTNRGSILNFTTTVGTFAWTQINTGLTSTYISSLAANPAGDLFAGAGGGGKVFRSTNNGDNWTESTTGSLAEVGALAINSSGHIFAGLSDGSAPAFRSTDNGSTWTQISTGLGSQFVNALAINSNGHVFAGTISSGVYRSTNNGDSWTRVATATATKNVYSLAINSSGHIFAGTGLYSGGTAGVFLSTDNGATWTNASTGLPSTLATVYAIIINSSGHIFAGVSAGTSADRGVFRSTNNGASWTQVSTGLPNSDIISLAMNTNGHLFAGTYGAGTYRTTDNGSNWSQLNSGLTNLYIEALIAGASGYVFAGTQNGMFRGQ